MADYLRPTSLDDALAALADRPWTMLAGGTDVYPANVGHPIPDDILDVTGLPSLREISVADDGLVRIPALATWTDVVRAELSLAFDGLKTAARSIGGIQIQNRGTLAGNLCNASPAADSVPALYAAGAIAVVVGSKGRREVPVEQIPASPGRTSLAKDEFILEFKFPPRAPRSGDAYLPAAC